LEKLAKIPENLINNNVKIFLGFLFLLMTIKIGWVIIFLGGEAFFSSFSSDQKLA
jgi:hypothetical protein